MAKVEILIPEDVSKEFRSISEENWQMLFARFVSTKLDEVRKIDNIVAASKATKEDVDLLSDDVRSAIVKRMLKK